MANNEDNPRNRGPRYYARMAGLKTYRTRNPCKNGHFSERNVRDGKCRECKFPSSLKHREYNARWKAKYPGRENEVRFRHRYGIELSEIRPKPTSCEICADIHPKIVFDHDHSTGQFRGWICDPCNIVLGAVKERIETLEKMAQYLKQHQQSNGSEQVCSKRVNQAIQAAAPARSLSAMRFA